FVHRAEIVEFANRERLPAAYGLSEFADIGGLMSYGVDLIDSIRQSAKYVDRILKGSKPSELPVEQPTKFEFVINRNTAKSLGLTSPQTLLLQADQVIE